VQPFGCNCDASAVSHFRLVRLTESYDIAGGASYLEVGQNKCTVLRMSVKMILYASDIPNLGVGSRVLLIGGSS
jgi:hypothetical protein